MRLYLIIILSLVGLFGQAQNAYINLGESEFMQNADFLGVINLSNVDLDLIEMGVFHINNQYRRKSKAENLAYNQALSNSAYLHSKEMTDHHFFDHYNKYNKELASLDKRTLFAGYTDPLELAENILYAYLSVDGKTTYKDLCASIVNDFYNSKGHRINMLDKNLKELGCGISFTQKVKDGYWYFNFTQEFGTKY